MASEYDRYYLKADESFIVNSGDVDLRLIRISLPRPPKIALIDGYGLPPEKQRFKRLEIPYKLKQLEEDAKALEREAAQKTNVYITRFSLQKRYWDMLFERKDQMSEEILWLKKIWWHRLHGYWFFNHGKPTYITGWHFDYLNFWYIEEVKPDGHVEYRDRDRREFLFHKYANETTETFAKRDKNGWAVPEFDGRYKMIDRKRRVCYGLGQPKNRRSGNTNKGLLIVFSVTSTTKGTDGGGIMSYTGDNAETHFKGKLIEAFNRMPLFIRPYCNSGFAAPNQLRFKIPANEFDITALNNEITYADTASSTFYNGKKLTVALLDEEGATVTTDVDSRWGTVKNCQSQGDGAIIHGYCYHPSTAEEYTAGGAAYRSMMNKSSFYQRKPNGQTQSGIFRIYMRSDDGLDDYIDSHGFSVKDVILPYQRKEGFKETATSHIMDDFDFLLKQDTPESLSEYRKKRKQFPMSWKDVWVGDSGEIGFPTELIIEQINVLRRKELTVPGNFEWTKGRGSDVYWNPNSEGRWEASELFEHLANRRIRDIMWDPIDMTDREVWAPQDPSRGTIGADPFGFKKKSEVKQSHSKTGMSDGGITGYWEYDERMDGDKKLRSEYESDNVVCTYRYRGETDDDFCEDVLKTCIWYGWMVYPEMNLPIVAKKFREWGYMGYLKYDINPDGMPKDAPGVYLHGNNKQEGFNKLRTFFQYRCKHIKHMKLLEEARDISNIEELRNYDTLASCMAALMGADSGYAKAMQRMSDASIDISKMGEFFRQRTY